MTEQSLIYRSIITIDKGGLLPRSSCPSFQEHTITSVSLEGLWDWQQLLHFGIGSTEKGEGFGSFSLSISLSMS